MLLLSLDLQSCVLVDKSMGANIAIAVHFGLLNVIWCLWVGSYPEKVCRSDIV